MKQKTLLLFQLFLAVFAVYAVLKYTGNQRLYIPLTCLFTMFLIGKVETAVTEKDKKEQKRKARAGKGAEEKRTFKLNDFFNYQGVMDTYYEVKDYYRKINSPDAFNMVVDEGGHQSTKKNREALYAFFQKHLDLPGTTEDLEVSVFSPEQLNVTKTGQVLTDLNGKTVFSLNKVEAEEKLKLIRTAKLKIF